MKSFVLFLTFFFLTVCLHAQTVPNKALQTYLQVNKYVLLKDKAHLPKAMMPYYKMIIDTISVKHPNLLNYYVLTSRVSGDKDFFYIMLYPLSGIKMIKEAVNSEAAENKAEQLKEQQDTAKDKIHSQIIDDFSGSVGELSLHINKVTRSMVFYQFH